MEHEALNMSLHYGDLQAIITTSITHFSQMFHFYTPWKHQKYFDYLRSSGGIKMEHWAKIS